MKAMILAAGKGTRLRPFTDSMPKALFPINDVTLLELLISKMKKAGIKDIIINCHHFAEKTEAFLKDKNYFDINIRISYEKELLETGGGLKKAKDFFSDQDSFLLHNADIVSAIDFNKLRAFHDLSGNMATLAVSERESSRYLLFNDAMELKGWENKKTKEKRIFSKQPLKSFAFSGIQILSPAIFDYFPVRHTFSLTDFYLDICTKASIGAYVHFAEGWFDVGKIEDVDKIDRQYSRLF